MRHLKRFNESHEINEPRIFNMIKKFSSSINSKKLADLVISNKKLIEPYYKKYVKNGKIMVDSIISDIKSLKFKANESSYYDNDYASDDNNHPVLRFLYKFFVRLPKNFILSLWGIFKDIAIDSWKDGWIIGVMSTIVLIIGAIFVIVLGRLSYEITEHSMHGLEKGKVKEIEFVPAHLETNIKTSVINNNVVTYTTEDWVPDALDVLVVGKGGREEVWKTHNMKLKNVKKGDVLTNDEDWVWIGTNSK